MVKKRYDHSIFLYNWKEVLYNLGILVFETEDVLENEMSGLSLYYDSMPYHSIKRDKLS